MKIAAGSASGSISLAGLTIVDLLNLDAKVVTGFENNTARSLATQRDEVIGYATYMGAVKADLDAGNLKPLFVIATQRDPNLPDIPAITELTNLSDDDVALVRLWENGLASGTILMAPIGIPADRLLYLRNIIHELSQKKSFRQEINQIAGYEITEYTQSEDLGESLHAIATTMESFQARFFDMIEKFRM
jgi:hypothetical protein